MRMNKRAITILTVTVMIIIASPASAQSQSDQVLFNSSILSEALDQTLVSLDNRQSSDHDDSESSPSFIRPDIVVIDVLGYYWQFFRARNTYGILGLGAFGALSVSPLDDDIRDKRVNASLAKDQNVGLDEVFGAGHILGGSILQVGGAFATYVIGDLVDRPVVAELGRDLVRAQLLAAGISGLLKHTVRRRRPGGSLRWDSRTSFPSGHAAGTFATAMILNDYYGWKAGVPAFAMASYVAISRVTDNSHFLSDVVFGAALGVSAGRTVNLKKKDAQLSVSPMFIPRGVGVKVFLH
jgi:membrane-associated phospholipid phosphatase